MHTHTNNVIHVIDPSPCVLPALSLETLPEIARLRGWMQIELDHAIDNLEVVYDEEHVVLLANGREIRTPIAEGGVCNYVRIVDHGCELAYWASLEWADAPEEVMGAIFGAAVSNTPAPENQPT